MKPIYSRNTGGPVRARRQQGQVFVVFALFLVMLVGTVGLAVDSGLGYLIRARLSAAVDAAAVAGARATSIGDSRAEQRQEAIAAAEKFFAANYPVGYLGSKGELSEIDVQFDAPRLGSITVKVAARAESPTAFVRVLGFDRLDITALAHTVRKDIDMAFVIDTSGSMAHVGPEVRQHAAGFLNRFNPAIDRVSLIHFATGAELDVPIRTGANRGFNRPAMIDAIRGYRFTGFTNSAEGFWHGRNQLNRVAAAHRSSLRVVVFFSDGSPNTLSSVFRFRDSASCNRAGSMATGDGGNAGAPAGLWDHARQDTMLHGPCYRGGAIASSLATNGMPEWYNAHDPSAKEFAVVTNSPRVVTRNTNTPEATYINVNRAAKNVVEAMAERARTEGIHVFTLGLGSLLKTVSGPGAAPDDTGENLLKCMANTLDAPARCRASNQPTGVYCHASSASELQPCFSMLASEILRISR